MIKLQNSNGVPFDWPSITDSILSVPVPIMVSRFRFTFSALGSRMNSPLSTLFLCSYSALDLSLYCCLLTLSYSDFLLAYTFLCSYSAYFLFLSYSSLAILYLFLLYSSFLSDSNLYCYFLCSAYFL